MKCRLRPPYSIVAAVLAVAAARMVAAEEQVQAAAEADTKLDEIVVTAQKRAQNLQDVGISITAFDSNSLAKLGLHDTTDLVRQVPGLQFNQFSPTITVFNLRGVSQNDYADHEEAPVAVYSDEAYIAAMGAIAGAMYDIDRVEVLRGPQGTLFGRNATGGLVHFVSKQPTNDENAYIQVTAGEHDQLNTEGAVNIPLTDSVTSRTSFATNYHGGLIENRFGPNSENQRQFAAREQLKFRITDDVDYLFKLYGVRNANERGTNYSWKAAYPNAQGLGVAIGPNENPWATCNGCDLGGYRNPSGDPFNQAYARPDAGLFDRTLYGATGKLTWRFSGATLTAITDFQNLRKQYGEDTDASPNFILWYNSDQRYRQFSQEIRLNGRSGAVDWTAGIYYFNAYSDDSTNSPLPDFLGGTVGSTYNVKTFSYAGFAQGEWAINERWSVTLGGRYTQDQKIDNYNLWAPTPDAVFASFNTSTNPELANKTWHLPSGKLELDYKVDGNHLLYSSVSRGVKGGGFSQPGAPPVLPAEKLPFSPEKLTSYEVGTKNTLLNGRARINGAAFYYDYKDYQAFEAYGITSVIANLQAHIAGAELEAAIVPLEGLDITFSASTLTARVKNVILPGGEMADRVMPQAPKWSLNASARYQWTALNSTWSVESDAKTDSASFFDTYNAPVNYEGGHTVANARVTYTNSAGNLSVALFCKNLTDRRYRIYSSDLSGLGFADQVYAPPRWFGGTITYHWH